MSETNFQSLLTGMVNPALLSEEDVSGIRLIQESVAAGQSIGLTEDEQAMLVGLKNRIALLEENLDEATLTALQENAVTEWFGYFFKGFSDDEVKSIKAGLNQVKDAKAAKDEVDSINKVIDKVKAGGDGSHTAGNWVLAFTPPLGVWGLIGKHIIKSSAFKKDKAKAIKSLEASRDALVKKYDL